MDTAVQVLGWIGSAILIWSLMQKAVLRFRILNLVAAVLLVVFNALVGVWPMAAMNAVIVVINLWQIRHLVATRDDDRVWEVLELGPSDPYARKFLDFYASDIQKYQPDFVRHTADPAARSAYLVLRDAIPAGLVLVHDHGGGEGHVELDYVVPEERDFTPGQFVYRKSGLFRDKGFTRLVATARSDSHRHYLERMGFRAAGNRYVLQAA
jgi:hypothetical protein